MRVEGVAPFDIERIDELSLDGYPERGPHIQYANEMEFGQLGLATKTSQRVAGHRFAAADRYRVALMAESGFVFGQVAPYDTWDAFSAEALRLWELYVGVAQPEAVTRIALRYINQIKRPPGEVSVDKYLRTRPEISGDMPTTTTGFYLSMDIPLIAHGAMCRVTETILPIDDDPDQVILVLDIDVHQDARYDPRAIEELRSVLDVLRDAKNMVFEASITNEARELFR